MKRAPTQPALAYAQPSFLSTIQHSILLKSVLGLASFLLVLRLVYAQPQLQIPLRVPSQAEHLASQDVAQDKNNNNASFESQPGAYTEADVEQVAGQPLWAITYTPYTKSGTCKHAHEILSDLDSIAALGFTAIRLYSTDCAILSVPSLPAVLRSNELGLIMGLYISNAGIASLAPQVDDLLAFDAPDLLQMVVVGNDAVFNEFVTAQELVDAIGAVRGALRDMGYDGPVTAVEPITVLHEYAQTLCPALDVLASNIQPFFDAGCAPEDAGRVVLAQLDRLELVCEDSASASGRKDAFNLETGWPSAGRAHFAAVPGVEEQRVAVGSIWREAGARSVLPVGRMRLGRRRASMVLKGLGDVGKSLSFECGCSVVWAMEFYC